MNKKTIWLLLTIFVLLIPSALAAETVTRSFDKTTVAPGGEVEVTLKVEIESDTQTYLIEETYPSGWTVINPGALSTGTPGKLKKVVVKDLLLKPDDFVSTTYTYKIQAPSQEGTATFTGQYSFDGEAFKDIAGDTQITITSCIPDCTGKECGNDGCGGSCGECVAGKTCTNGKCVTTTPPICGDGTIDSQERCDDGNTDAGDGCSPQCLVEAEYTCTGEPSICQKGEPLSNIDLLLQKIKTILQREDDTLVQISAIASALKDYFK